MRISWQPSYETGVEEIDQQHRELFEKGNEFFKSVEKSKNPEEHIIILNYLVEYVKFHFNTEEKMMKRKKYSLAPTHKDNHVKLVQELVRIYTKLINQGYSSALSQEIFEFLQGWFVNHIHIYDRKLAEFLTKSR